MVALRLVEEPLMLQEICSKRGMRCGEGIEAYFVTENGANVGACIFKVEEDTAKILFADHNIVQDRQLSDLTLRATLDYLIKNGVKQVVNYAAFPQAVMEPLGFAVSEFGSRLSLEGFSFGCGSHPGK